MLTCQQTYMSPASTMYVHTTYACMPPYPTTPPQHPTKIPKWPLETNIYPSTSTVNTSTNIHVLWHQPYAMVHDSENSNTAKTTGPNALVTNNNNNNNKSQQQQQQKPTTKANNKSQQQKPTTKANILSQQFPQFSIPSRRNTSSSWSFLAQHSVPRFWTWR